MSDKKRTVAVILLAAGESRRYGGIKLLDEIVDGKKMYLYALEILREITAVEKVVVTGYQEIQEKAEGWGIKTVKNDQPRLGISRSLQMGLKKVLEHSPEIDGVLFLVCDQPYLSVKTVNQMLEAFENSEKDILCPVPVGSGLEDAGNPCVIGKRYFDELFALSGDVGGKKVIFRHTEEIELFPIQTEKELVDIDTRS